MCPVSRAARRQLNACTCVYMTTQLAMDALEQEWKKRADDAETLGNWHVVEVKEKFISASGARLYSQKMSDGRYCVSTLAADHPDAEYLDCCTCNDMNTASAVAGLRNALKLTDSMGIQNSHLLIEEMKTTTITISEKSIRFFLLQKACR
jgi:hypothetical protein